MSDEKISYYDLFHQTLRILDSKVDEDGDSIERDCFSHTSGHYTVSDGYEWWATATIIARALVRLDDECLEEVCDLDPTSPSVVADVVEELAISPSGCGDPDEKLVVVLEDEGYGEISFSEFLVQKVRKLADKHYLVQFSVKAESGNCEKKQQWAEEDEGEAQIDAYIDRMEAMREGIW